MKHLSKLEVTIILAQAAVIAISVGVAIQNFRFSQLGQPTWLTILTYTVAAICAFSATFIIAVITRP